MSLKELKELEELQLFCEKIIEKIQKRFKHPRTEEEYENTTKGDMHEAGMLYMVYHIQAEIINKKKMQNNPHKRTTRGLWLTALIKLISKLFK